MCVLAALPAVAGAATPPRMELLSQSFRGGFPNGPSADATISGDRQLATLAAFDSDASNIVKGDRNGFRDVFLVHRAKPYSLKGEPWKRGKTTLVTRGRGGRPANGNSYLPDLDGGQTHSPRCVAFISDASNLVGGDTNGVADAFVKNLRTGRIKRVSVNSSGVQADGASYEVKVDAHCDRVAFVSDATNLALTGTSKLAWKGSVTSRPGAGTKQVYVRILGYETDNTGLSGLTFLASASPTGEAGNGSSDEVAFARAGGGCGRQGRCGNFSGESVFFTSRATNLSAADTDPGVDVYQRAFPRRFVRIRFPRSRHIDGESVRSTLVGVGPLQTATKLISVTQAGERGNGPSDQPAATDAGNYVVFRTAATNLFHGDVNGVTDVVREDTRDGSIGLFSRTDGGTVANRASAQPAIGRTGQDIVFESDASNFDGNDKNCTGDIYHLDIPANHQLLASLDSMNHVPNAPFGTSETCPQAIAAPLTNPAVSLYLNYLVLDSSYLLLDHRAASKAFPHLSAAAAAYASSTNPKLRQVYLRYVGPR
ncbi:MAG: hypothetical protein QOC95_1643 [Thermoleophilaceae bacterium]|nr:hypothetical protein [Thermoleophilaceae bacterium]